MRVFNLNQLQILPISESPKDSTLIADPHRRRKTLTENEAKWGLKSP
jgi:hypothetical protein